MMYENQIYIFVFFRPIIVFEISKLYKNAWTSYRTAVFPKLIQPGAPFTSFLSEKNIIHKIFIAKIK